MRQKRLRKHAVCLDIRAAVQEELTGFHLPEESRGMERRRAVDILGVDIVAEVAVHEELARRNVPVAQHSER